MAIVEDRRPDIADRVPFAVTDPRYVPAERYYDRRFFDLEKEKLWPKVWQVACRLEELGGPGDFVEYSVADYSVFIVRQPDASLKAFFNACPHRATQLCRGSGRFGGGQIVCPFHGWRWTLDGTNSFVYGDQGFDPDTIRPDDIRLVECQVDTFGGCVWINMDATAPPLAEALAPAGQMVEAIGAENMRVWWWKQAVVNANWKIALEAFLEGYHVMQTHTHLTGGLNEQYPPDSNYVYSTHAHGHGSFRGKGVQIGGGRTNVTADQFIARSRVTNDGQDAMTLARDIYVFEGIRRRVAEGEDFGAAAVNAVYEYAAGAGIPMPPRDGEGPTLWGGEVFLFPNYVMLPMYGNSLVWRFRPYGDDPERCLMDGWSLTTYPEGLEPPPPKLRGCFSPDDVENWGVIPRQDFANMDRQQRGLHNPNLQRIRLSAMWETLISNMHGELDRYLGAS